jgi:Putative porin
MKRWLSCAAGLWLMPASWASAQDATFQKEKPFQFKLDALARGEWTRDIFVTATSTTNDDRRRLQARPALEAHFGPVRLGVGAELNYSSDKNYETSTGAAPALIRDNYKSRDARVDLAFAEYESSWVHVQGGRFEMPVGLTEMIWDKDLRPQGGAVSLGLKDRGALKRAAITGLWARGSHVFDDGDATMSLVSGNVVFRTGETGSVELVGSYLDFSDFQGMQAGIRRQNTRVGGQLVLDYNVMDFVARFRRSGAIPLQLVAEYGWNTAVDANNHGLWLAGVLGSLQSGVGARLDYTYAKVDKDTTLAAYGADDFFWVTGWRGHRGELGFKLLRQLSVHAVAHFVQFKDSPRPEERDHWLKRYRAELRFKY